MTISKLIVKQGRTKFHINYNDIKWFNTDGNYTTIFLQNNEKKISRISLLELLEHLPAKQFIRIHKSYIINKIHVSEIRASRILIDGEVLPIGRIYQQNVMTFFK